jgi:pimeloyl-ACP methyl ester carboxylesterase
MLTAAVNVVLVHGAWCDATSWAKVIPILEAGGKNVVAVDNQMLGLYADAANTRDAINKMQGPTIVAGHSYGGAVITAAAHDAKNVAGLVYIAAFAPDERETLTAITSKFSPPSGAKFIRAEPAGMLVIDPAHMAAVFAGDLPDAESDALVANQRSVSPLIFSDKMGPPAWKQHKSWYAVSEDDRMINPGAERFMAARARATTIALKASHVSLLSHPQQVAGLILNACASSS